MPRWWTTLPHWVCSSGAGIRIGSDGSCGRSLTVRRVSAPPPDSAHASRVAAFWATCSSNIPTFRPCHSPTRKLHFYLSLSSLTTCERVVLAAFLSIGIRSTDDVALLGISPDLDTADEGRQRENLTKRMRTLMYELYERAEIGFGEGSEAGLQAALIVGVVSMCASSLRSFFWPGWVSDDAFAVRLRRERAAAAQDALDRPHLSRRLQGPRRLYADRRSPTRPADDVRSPAPPPGLDGRRLPPLFTPHLRSRPRDLLFRFSDSAHWPGGNESAGASRRVGAVAGCGPPRRGDAHAAHAREHGAVSVAVCVSAMVR